jgi:hypothetical protein
MNTNPHVFKLVGPVTITIYLNPEREEKEEGSFSTVTGLHHWTSHPPFDPNIIEPDLKLDGLHKTKENDHSCSL